MLHVGPIISVKKKKELPTNVTTVTNLTLSENVKLRIRILSEHRAGQRKHLPATSGPGHRFATPALPNLGKRRGGPRQQGYSQLVKHAFHLVCDVHGADLVIREPVHLPVLLRDVIIRSHLTLLLFGDHLTRKGKDQGHWEALRGWRAGWTGKGAGVP